jgi:hypothetical protein
MTSAYVTERADFLKNHYTCNSELGITEELIFEHAVYQDVLNMTLPGICTAGYSDRLSKC